MNETELAWAAGFFDGEGCTFSNGKDYPRLVVFQKDRRPLDRFAAAVGFGHVRPCHSPAIRRVGFQWVVNDWQEARKVHALLWPYLSEPKCEQANEKWDVFEARRLEDPNLGQGRGRRNATSSPHRNNLLAHLISPT